MHAHGAARRSHARSVERAGHSAVPNTRALNGIATKQNGNLNALRRINETLNSDNVRATVFLIPPTDKSWRKFLLYKRCSKTNYPVRGGFQMHRAQRHKFRFRRSEVSRRRSSLHNFALRAAWREGAPKEQLQRAGQRTLAIVMPTAGKRRDGFFLPVRRLLRLSPPVTPARPPTLPPASSR
jgi:hypothetical protein